MKTYFITGTDTNCGKTYVTCQLLDYFSQQQKKAFALKPIASGCFKREGQLYSEDVLSLKQHNPPLPYAVNGWQFAAPISPHLAAKEEGVRLTARDIADFCLQQPFADLDYLLIEGVGGIMVPLNEQETWIDFLKLTQIPLILVVGMRLGCINHALLSAAILKINQLECVGWIANCLDKNMLALRENIETLSLKMPIPLFATLPYLGSLEPKFAL